MTATLLLSVGAGCTNDAGGNDGSGRCPAVREAAVQAVPLYFASDDPHTLELSASERSAIGVIEPHPPIALCTGVVVARHFVLTAAHCEIGDDLTFRASNARARAVTAVATTLHPSLDAMLLEFDVDLIRHFDLAPIALWDSGIDETWVGEQVTLAGVGETETGTYGDLRFVDEEVVAVSGSEIGVHGMGRSGACAGDSGGPILVAAQDGSPRIAGVLDRGSRDCIGLDIYIRSDRLHDWVTEVTGGACAAE